MSARLPLAADLTPRPLSLRQPAARAYGRPWTRALGAATFAAVTGSAYADPMPDPANAESMEAVVVEGVAPKGDNPYADPAAPYKVDRSASDKLTQPLLDVSKSISAIPKEVISDAGAHTLKELLRTQPGVTLGTGEGGNAFGDRFIIRGFDVRNDVFVDGVRDAGVIPRETFAIEQVEIAKGPGSAFAGRGTTGAAVNLVTKAPSALAFGDIEATVGSDSTRRLTADINQPLGETSALRVNLMQHDGGTAGRDTVDQSRQGLALALALRPSANWDLGLDLYHYRADSLPDWGVPYDAANNRPFAVDRNNYYGVVGRDFWNAKADLITLKSRLALGDDLVWTTTLRQGDTANAYVASAPERPDPLARTVLANAKTRDQDNAYLALQTQLVGVVETAGIAHEWVAGVEASAEDVHNTPYVVTPRGISLNLDRPQAALWTGTVVRGPATSRRKVDTLAAYLFDSVSFNAHWEAFAGLRFDRYQIEGDSIVSDYVDEASRLSNEADFLNGHVGLIYKPVANASLYVSLSSSSNPTGEQLDAGAVDYGAIGASNQNLEPERNRSAELGAKWNLADGHLALNAALFQIDKENAAVTSGTGAAQTTVLAGEQRVRGLELGLAGNLTPALSVFGGYTWLDTSIRNSPLAAQVGAQLPNVAEHSFNLQTRWDATRNLSVGGTLTYTGERFGGTSYALDTRIPGYWRVDLLAEYTFDRHLSLQAHLLNATDKVYYDTLYRSATPFTYIAPGRSALVSLRYSF